MVARPTQDPPMDHDRLTELEIRLAHHERVAEDLSAVLLEQQNTIDALRAMVLHLRDRIGALERDRPLSDDKPPPHY